MSGWKRMAAAVRSSLIHRVFQSVGDSFGQTKGLAELQGALVIPKNQGLPARVYRQNKLQNIAGRLNTISCPGVRGTIQTTQSGQHRALDESQAAFHSVQVFIVSLPSPSKALQ